eukprot:gene6961-2231_t
MVQWDGSSSSSSVSSEPDNDASATQTPANWNSGLEIATQTAVQAANETATQTAIQAANETATQTEIEAASIPPSSQAGTQTEAEDVTDASGSVRRDSGPEGQTSLQQATQTEDKEALAVQGTQTAQLPLESQATQTISETNNSQTRLAFAAIRREPAEARMSAIADACVKHVLRLPLESRRDALSVGKVKVLEEVEKLGDCQRCGFVRHVLAAFMPTLTSHQHESGNAQRKPSCSSSLPKPDPPGADAVGTSCPVGPGENERGEGREGMPASQLIPFLAPSRRLVNLLQFVWREPEVVVLSDSLLTEDRLLSKFLEEAIACMRELEAEVGDCSRHKGNPGPSQLDCTARRLAQQQQACLNRLQALGVLLDPTAEAPTPESPFQELDPFDNDWGADEGEGEESHPPGSRVLHCSAAAREGGETRPQAPDAPQDPLSPKPDACPSCNPFQSPKTNRQGPATLRAQSAPQSPSYFHLPPLLPPFTSLSGGGGLATPPRPRPPSERIPTASASARLTPSRLPSNRTRSDTSSSGHTLARLAGPHTASTGTLGAALLPTAASMDAGLRRYTPSGVASRQLLPSVNLPQRQLHQGDSLLHPLEAVLPGGAASRQLHQQDPVLRPLEAVLPGGAASRQLHRQDPVLHPSETVLPGGAASRQLHQQEPLVQRLEAVLLGLEPCPWVVRSDTVAALEGELKANLDCIVQEMVQVGQRQARLERAREHGFVAASKRLLLLLLRHSWATLTRHYYAQKAEEAFSDIMLPPQQPLATADDSRVPSRLTSWVARNDRIRDEMLQDICTSHRCESERQDMHEQMATLSCQLISCQTAQAEMAAELSMILDRVPSSMSDAEDAKKLRAWQGEPETLKAMSAEDLEALERKVEASLASIRAAHAKAAASQENICAVCWERKKDTIFQCGHATCSECGDKLTACCICRQPIAIRIRMY